jgi:hypothetical protein
MADEGLTRRDMLAAGAATAMGLALGRPAEGAELFNAQKPTSTVVLVRRGDAVTGGHQVHGEVVAEMIDQAVATLAGVEDPAEAWKRYVKPQDVVGVKISKCKWMQVHVEQATIDAVRARVLGCGVEADRLHVTDWDFPAAQCTAAINVPTIKVHRSVGIAVSLKNYINVFTRKCSQFHKGLGDRLGENWVHPDMKGKTRLIVVDALRPYFGPGPQVNPVYRWAYGGIFVGTDPVAIDTIAIELMRRKRDAFKGEPWPLNPPPRVIPAADTKYGLGTCDPAKIKLVRLGARDGMLI